MSEKTVTCKKCGAQVPKKKFCCDCGAELVIVDQPTRTTQQDKDNTPVQVSNSDTYSGVNESATGQSTAVVNEPPSPQSATHGSHTDRPANEETSDTPSSYAEVTRSKPSNGQRTSSQQNNQGSLSDNGSAEDGKESANVTTSGNKIQVVFHFLIPTSVWNWTEYSQLRIRFINNAQPRTSEWNEVSPKLSQYQWQNIDAREATAFVYLPMSYLNKKIPYKYVIYSAPHSTGMWEYIHDLQDHGSFNRCLDLNQSSSTQQRVFPVYDGYIFPNESWWNRISNYIRITGIGTKESYGQALRIFLQTVNLKISVFNISKTVDTVSNIYFQLKQKKYLHYTDPRRYTSFCCIDQLDGGLQQSVAENVRGGTVLEANFGNPLLGNQRKKYLKPNIIPLMFLSVAFYLELLPVTSPFMLKVMFRSARIVLYRIAGFIM